MPSAAELRDGDLVLRAWREDDFDAIGYTLRSPEIDTFLGLPSSGAFPPPDPDAPKWAIVDHGVPVGRVWTTSWSRPPEVGYYLRPDAQGRGLATRSVILVRDYLGGPLELCIHPRNERSQRVAGRAGFRRDGVVENYARFKDGETTAWRYVWP